MTESSAVPEQSAVQSDLPDLTGTPLADIATAASDADLVLDETLRRIAPVDGGRVLLVAASFNSAI